MALREYRLGRRQAEVARTRAAILSAARQVVAEVGPAAGLATLAKRAGVSRITVYNHFGSKAGLLEALSVAAGRPSQALLQGADPSDDLKDWIAEACAAWAADPGLYRQLQARARIKDANAGAARAPAPRSGGPGRR